MLCLINILLDNLAYSQYIALNPPPISSDDGQTPTFPPRKGRAFSGESEMQQYKEAEIARAVEEIKKELARRDALERKACLEFWRELAIAKRKEVATA